MKRISIGAGSAAPSFKTNARMLGRSRAVLPTFAILVSLWILNACSSIHATHFAIVAGGLNSVVVNRVDNRSGAITTTIGSPFVAGASPSSVVIHPSKQFVYVANQGENTISLFKIDASSGALTEVPPRTSTGISPCAGISPVAMTMDSNGSFLFVADQISNDIAVFSIGSTGALSSSGCAIVGSSPAGLTLTSSGFLYVPVPNFSAIYVFSVSSGTLTQVGAPFTVSNGVSTLAVDPGGSFLFAPNPSTNTVTVFKIQSNGYPALGPGAFATSTAPVAATVDTSGKYLYVANFGAATVSQYSFDSTTGTLTPLTASSPSAGTNSTFIVTDPDGKFIFVGNQGARSITEFTISSDGSLASTSNTIQPGFQPRSLSVTK